MLKFLFKKISECIKDTKAIVIPTFAIMALTAVTITLTAFDINSYMSTRAALQALADQATLSSLATDDTSIIDTDRQDLCQNIFIKGIENNPKIKGLVTRDSVTCTFRANLSQMFLETNVTIKPALSGMTGVKTNTRISSTSAINDNSLEIVLAVSTAGTMCMTMTNPVSSTNGGYLHLKPEPNGEYTTPYRLVKVGLSEGNCSKLSAVKVGIGNLLHYVEKMTRVKIGFIPYHYKVAFPDNNNIPGSLGGNPSEPAKPITSLTKETDAFFNSDNFTDAEQVSKITPFFDLKDDIDNNVGTFMNKYEAIIADGFVSAPHITPWTRTDLPMHVAALMLDPGHESFFGHTVKPWGTDDHQKIVILMTDGVNMGCCYTQNGLPTNQYIYHYEKYTQNTWAICTALKAQGVIIYTIMVNVPTDPAYGSGVAKIKTMMQNCASDPDKSFSVDFIQDQKSVSKAFADIGQNIFSPKVVR
jgi:hypothetical protein